MRSKSECHHHSASDLRHSATFEKLRQVYGEVLSRTQVFRWFKAFSKGRESIDDESRTGRPSSSRTNDNLGRVYDLVRSDRRWTVRMIDEELNLLPQMFIKF